MACDKLPWLHPAVQLQLGFRSVDDYDQHGGRNQWDQHCFPSHQCRLFTFPSDTMRQILQVTTYETCQIEKAVEEASVESHPTRLRMHCLRGRRVSSYTITGSFHASRPC